MFYDPKITNPHEELACFLNRGDDSQYIYSLAMGNDGLS